jgi:hypothetical protein
MYPPTSPYAPLPSPPARTWWRRPAVAIALLVLFPPVGIALAWLVGWTRRTKVLATVASAAWFVFVLASPSGGASHDDGAGPAAAVTATASETTTAPEPSVTPSPSASPSPTASPTATPEPTTPEPTTPTPTPERTTTAPEDRRWASCAAAWRGGVPDTGLTSGVDRGYRAALDSDGDGTACSKYLPEQSVTADDDSGGTDDGTSDDESGGTSGATSGDDDVSYANCAAVRAAGAAPIHAGEPGYSRHLDRDGDGVACE